MKRRRHTPEQIIRKLAEGDKLLAQGQPLEDVARHLEIEGVLPGGWSESRSEVSEGLRRAGDGACEGTPLVPPGRGPRTPGGLARPAPPPAHGQRPGDAGVGSSGTRTPTVNHVWPSTSRSTCQHRRVRQPARGPGGCRGVADRVQHLPAPLVARRVDARRVQAAVDRRRPPVLITSGSGSGAPLHPRLVA
jgi:hypothetical protein